MRNPFSSKVKSASDSASDSASTAAAPAPATGAFTEAQPAPDKSSSQFFKAVDRQIFQEPPRILVIGAGSRGTAYAAASLASTNAVVAAVAEPVAYKRAEFGRKFIWGDGGTAGEGQAFETWEEWSRYEMARREREREGKVVGKGIDAVFVCVLDEMHEDVVCMVAKMGVHVCVEKPLGVGLEACLNMYKALGGPRAVANGHANGSVNGSVNGNVDGAGQKKERVFGICHVLRYSPHNMLLRHLVLDEGVIGDVLSVEHVEPVGWWHFSHSYVRGNWRKESTTAPSLLTKSCHDIDFLMWLMCSPSSSNGTKPHLPSYLTSTGSRKYFRKERKPREAGDATNCLSCPHEPDCDYSAKKIYLERHLKSGNTGWPVKIVNPEIEDCYRKSGMEAASKQLLDDLRQDWTEDMPVSEVEKRPWFGRCVWEADNDVCDDQCVTLTWDDDPIAEDEEGRPIVQGRGAKTAQFHMVAFTEKICERRGRIYGTHGEIEYDSATISVHEFATGHTTVHKPHIAGGGHGGGDEGLARQFLMAVEAVDGQGMPAAEAQRKFLGCDLEEAFRSHAVVFAAEEARTKRKVVDWKQWWSEQVEPHVHER